MSKKILAIVLTVALAMSSLGFSASNAKNSLDEDNLKAMILLIKNKLEIGEEYTQFDYNYYESNGGNEWSFNWRTADDLQYIYVNCDDEGHIENYSTSYNEESSSIPELTKKEAEAVFFEWLKQVEPEIVDKIKVTNSYFVKYNNSYRFVFNRTENGIPMPDNSVTAMVSACGKGVSNYSEKWDYAVSIPNSDGIMTADEAASIIKQNVKMELQYRLGWDEEGNEKVFLAYSPDKSYISVNAKTGKVYVEKSYWNASEDDFSTATDEVSNSADKGQGATLTEAEIAKAEDIKGIITSEDAVKLLKSNKYLYIDENINSVSSSLMCIDGRYIWYINMEDNRDIYDYEYDYYRAYAYAEMDAVTGQILSYYSSVKNEYVTSEDKALSIDIKYTKKQCRNIYEAFVKETMPEKLASVKLSDSRKSYIIYADYMNEVYIYGGYDFSYTRYNENVPFYSNWISGSVDAVTGKVYEFNYYWTEAELPSTKDVIGESQAFDSYISQDGYDLVYELITKYTNSDSVYGYTVKNQARLVYRTDMDSTIVDAFTGKALNYDGSEYTKTTTNYEYKDIAGSKYERIITLLADMGVGLEGDSFSPDQAITIAEFKKLLELAGYGRVTPICYPIYLLDTNVVTTSAVAGSDTVLTTQVNENKKLTRQMAASLIIEAMGMEELAAMDIFKTGYSDEDKIDAANIGAVALLKGYEIMGAKKGNKFMPNAKLTRGEAAEIIFGMLTK